mgnify:CR=1 FL=1|jgi:dTDP-4-dehydrorhamnose reductase|tara:strand:+ start:106 stop:870 length:765 start_codon:yes stop_codon:yes gene_type:complete
MNKKNKILVTGINSGLGKYLVKELKCYGLSRKSDIKKLSKIKWNLIIHCAVNTKKINFKNDLIKQINDNLVLSYNISNFSGKKIFISSCAVYEKIDLRKRIEKKIDFINNDNSQYSMNKILSESFFINDKNNVILRMGSIVGKPMKNNTIYKILNNNLPKIGVRANSQYSFISYKEIYEFISLVVNKKISGIYNFLRTDYNSIKNISNNLFPDKKIKFGNYQFSVVKADNHKISKLFLKNKKNTGDILKEYLVI